jgi:hypothetical protein
VNPKHVLVTPEENMPGFSIGFCGRGLQFQAYKSIGQSLK